MAEIPSSSEEEEKQREEAESTLNILLELQAKEEQAFLDKQHTPEEFEYYLASTHKVYEELIKKKAETNPRLWALYQEHKRNTIDPLALDKARAEKKHPTIHDRGMLQIEARLSKTSNKIKTAIEPYISPAKNDPTY